MIWTVRDRRIDLTQQAEILGILNVTPDSFSEAGAFRELPQALDHAAQMIAAGARIIDIGGESTRPGARPVTAAEELSRVMPVLRALRPAFPQAFLSIDTSKAEVARIALNEGADIINDVTAARGDPEMVEVLSGSKAGVILMHMQGTPQTMQIEPRYQDVVAEVGQFLQERRDVLVKKGIEAGRIALDPGFGFGKSPVHNLSLIRGIGSVLALHQPVVAGISRKTIIARLVGDLGLPYSERVWPTVALTCFFRRKGVHLHRVHDVGPNQEAMRVTEEILSA